MNSRFFNADKLASLTTVAKGQKATSDLYPELLVNRSIHKFRLNSLASAALDLKDGDRVVIITMPGATEVGERFFIAKSSDDAGSICASTNKGGSEAKPLGFTYAGVWSQMVQEKADSVVLSENDLVKAGILRPSFTQLDKKGQPMFKNQLPHRLVCRLEQVFLGDEENKIEEITIGDTVYAKLFAIATPVRQELVGKELENSNITKEEVLARIAAGENVDVATEEDENPDAVVDEEQA